MEGEVILDIKYFKEKFIDFIDDCNECGVFATIHVHDAYCFSKWWGVVDKCTIKNGVAILNVVDYAQGIEYQFTDKAIFDNVSKVVFCIKDKIIEDAELVDTSWSDRTFGFEVDLG